ncbi:sigma-70 family RNA polymerase sigma factor [Kineococcus terrestris]|uniref:sigma-70 family RNA polymerase sigma factor n=1 Tax=Kineococcus terrestris TaxID=2044856 RepID=UPI0034DB5083
MAVVTCGEVAAVARPGWRGRRGAPLRAVDVRGTAPGTTSGTPGADPGSGAGGFDVDAAYREEAGPLLAFAVNALGDRAAAEDALQETFVRAWRARERYARDEGSVRTWLFAIARNVVVDAHRARQRRPRPVDPATAAEPAGGAAPAAATLPGVVPGVVRDPAAASVDRLLVHEALARLSPEHRQVVVAVHLRGAGYQELSAVTGVPVATLRTRMHHALKALRRTLEEGGERRG